MLSIDKGGDVTHIELKWWAKILSTFNTNNWIGLLELVLKLEEIEERELGN